MLYIVLPCYNEEEVLCDSIAKLTAMLDKEMPLEAVRLLCVDDGSRDRTWSLIQELSQSNPRLLGLRLAHNVGHQQALWAGLEAALPHAEAVISIDADLQDDIQVIPRMMANFRAGSDIVYGVRRERRTDTWFKRTTALAFYKLMQWMGCESVYNHADFRLLSRRALAALLSYPERNLFLRGMVAQLGFQTSMQYYDRSERLAGETKYPLSKMLSFALDGITSFSVRPIRLINLLGILFILVGLVVSCKALADFLRGQTMPGWTSLLISLWLIGGALMLAVGITGEYIGKIYTEVKRRPRYFEMERAGDNWENS